MRNHIAFDRDQTGAQLCAYVSGMQEVHGAEFRQNIAENLHLSHPSAAMHIYGEVIDFQFLFQFGFVSLQTRRPPNDVRRYDVRRNYASFSSKAGNWEKAPAVVAKVEWHLGMPYPRARFICGPTCHARPSASPPSTIIAAPPNNTSRTARTPSTRPRRDCYGFRANEAHLQLDVLAYNAVGS